MSHEAIMFLVGMVIGGFIGLGVLFFFINSIERAIGKVLKW